MVPTVDGSEILHDHVKKPGNHGIKHQNQLVSLPDFHHHQQYGFGIFTYHLALEKSSKCIQKNGNLPR